MPINVKLPPEFNEEGGATYANAEPYLVRERLRDEKKEMIQQYKITLRTLDPNITLRIGSFKEVKTCFYSKTGAQ